MSETSGGPGRLPASPGANGLAIAGVVCGILWGFGVLSVLALIFGVLARGQIRDRGDGGRWLAAAGVVLGAVGIAGSVLFAVVVAGGVDEIELDRNGPATVQIRARTETCWTVTVTRGGSGSSLSQSQEQGCGNADHELGTGPGRTAVVARVSGSGPLTAVVLVDGQEVDRRTTNAARGTFSVSPEEPEG